MEIERAYVLASLVDRTALRGHQEANDALMAAATLRAAYRTDVDPILAMARLRKGCAIDPVATFRAAGYRARVAAERPRVSGSGGGIV
jgi:L-rhamnose isomerase/sugar isomerase